MSTGLGNEIHYKIIILGTHAINGILCIKIKWKPLHILLLLCNIKLWSSLIFYTSCIQTYTGFFDTVCKNKKMKFSWFNKEDDNSPLFPFPQVVSWKYNKPDENSNIEF